jgi:hypothetical protein
MFIISFSALKGRNKNRNLQPNPDQVRRLEDGLIEAGLRHKNGF